MKAGEFYFIKDTFIDRYATAENHLKSFGTRCPCYCIGEDEKSPQLQWLVPISSHVDRHKMMQQMEKKYGSAAPDQLRFAEVNGVNNAFLIHNMFPVTEVHIKNVYKKEHKPLVLEPDIETDIIACAKNRQSLISSGHLQETDSKMFQMKQMLLRELNPEKESIQEIQASVSATSLEKLLKESSLEDHTGAAEKIPRRVRSGAPYSPVLPGKFYFIDDSFIPRHTAHDAALRTEKPNRPYFCAFTDSSAPDIHWLVPMSSKVPKYEKVIESRYKRSRTGYTRYDTLRFGMIEDEKKAFVVQNMFPVSDQYIMDIWKRKGKPVTLAPEEEKDVTDCARECLRIVYAGRAEQLHNNVLKMRASIVQEMKNRPSADDSKKTKPNEQEKEATAIQTTQGARSKTWSKRL